MYTAVLDRQPYAEHRRDTQVLVAMRLLHICLILCLASLGLSSRHGTQSSSMRTRGDQQSEISRPRPSRMLNHTHSGYLVVNETLGSDLFHIYWEATEPTMPLKHRPIILWLNGGPGCASLFGSLYLGGPWRVTEDLELVPNPGAWNRRFGMLFIDQPIGTGYSRAGEHESCSHGAAKGLRSKLLASISGSRGCPMTFSKHTCYMHQ